MSASVDSHFFPAEFSDRKRPQSTPSVNVFIYGMDKGRCCNTTKAVWQDFSGMVFPQIGVMFLWLEMFVRTFTERRFYRNRAIKGLSGLRFYTLTEHPTCLADFQFNSWCFIGCLLEIRATSPPSQSEWVLALNHGQNSLILRTRTFPCWTARRSVASAKFRSGQIDGLEVNSINMNAPINLRGAVYDVHAN